MGKEREGKGWSGLQRGEEEGKVQVGWRGLVVKFESCGEKRTDVGKVVTGVWGGGKVSTGMYWGRGEEIRTVMEKWGSDRYKRQCHPYHIHWRAER